MVFSDGNIHIQKYMVDFFCTKIKREEGRMKYGYCRISTRSQNIERQVRNIIGFCPDVKIIKEVYSGTTQVRPEWIKLLKILKKGDVVIFDSVSRMSRNAEEGFSTYKDLYDRGVELIFLKEPLINTKVYQKAIEKSISLTGTKVDLILTGINQYLLTIAEEQIRLSFIQSEKEVADLRQRTKEGILTARLNGTPIGRPKNSFKESNKSIKAKEVIRKHSQDFGGSLKDVEVIKLIGISRNSYYKYKRELFEQLEQEAMREA